MTVPAAPQTEPKRIKALRLRLCKEIPKFPNNANSLAVLEAKSLGDVLIDYLSWRIRYITPRARKVTIETTASADPRWVQFSAEIQNLLEAAAAGTDLTPYLSLLPHTKGFTPASSGTGPGVDKWADKDMLLFVMGYYHLHLDATPTAGMRSDDVLFVHVDRESFAVVGVFNHTVFTATPPGGMMEAERERLWKIYDAHLAKNAPPGAIIITSAIAISGHPVDVVYRATHYAQTIYEMDPKLDDKEFVRGLYAQIGVPVPKKLKLKWGIFGTELGLWDEQVNAFWSIAKGFN